MIQTGWDVHKGVGGDAEMYKGRVFGFSPPPEQWFL